MAALLFVGFLIIIGPLALWLGADSRDCDPNDVRGWWPAAPRRAVEAERNPPSGLHPPLAETLVAPAGAQEVPARPGAKAQPAVLHT
jgi:hypothetical protein